MEKISSSEIKNQENNTIIFKKEKEYKLRKDYLSYTISIKIEEKTSNKIIKIKTSEIINKHFYMNKSLIINILNKYSIIQIILNKIL